MNTSISLVCMFQYVCSLCSNPLRPRPGIFLLLPTVVISRSLSLIAMIYFVPHQQSLIMIGHDVVLLVFLSFCWVM